MLPLDPLVQTSCLVAFTQPEQIRNYSYHSCQLNCTNQQKQQQQQQSQTSGKDMFHKYIFNKTLLDC
ncbi:hypothetical protein BLOT_004660 [Blomia tropicalis]|nr:hypothetical protein BLOT_004660 [Blomia tropicalis]